jgi:RNA polymerase sigma factor (sigma-70 family)
MSEEASINLVARWRAGDEEAAAILFRRYSEQLIAVVSGRLSGRIAFRVDAEDVVQSAYRSFFTAARDGCYDLQRGGELWRLLVSITLNKLHDQVKRNVADKRSVNREQHLDGPVDALLSTRGPTPLEVVAIADELEHLLRQLQPLHRQMLELRLQGYRLEEVAEQTGRSLRTVCRVLDLIKNDLGNLAALSDRSEDLPSA